MLKKLLYFIFLLSIPVVLAGAGFAFWGYHYLTRDLPRLTRVEDYDPPGVSQLFSHDGTVIGEFYKERRYVADLDEIPLFVRNAFLAAEDATFYSHPGIDIISIFRAFVKNVQTGSTRQGGSTITQQVVKNLLLSSEKKLTRKAKEAILAYHIEQSLSKDDILQIYLNQIYFGNGAYGIKAAVRAYFHKELSEVTLGEAAMLAGLPKAPSRYSPIVHFDLAKGRQHYVLDQMVRAGFVAEAKAKEAREQEIQVYKKRTNTILAAPYYVSEVRRRFHEQFPELDLDRDGLKVYTPVRLQAQEYAREALREGLQTVDKRRGWRGPLHTFSDIDSNKYVEKYASSFDDGLIPGRIYPALLTKVLSSNGTVEAILGEEQETVTLSLRSSAWAKRRLLAKDEVQWVDPAKVLRVGDVIEVSFRLDKQGGRTFMLDQTPDLEGAVVLLDPTSGRVVSLVGGYSYQRSQFNRVTQSYRQPGSAFKPIVYLAAIDGYQYTPASIVHDVKRTFKVGDDYWEPGNFDKSYLGEITLRSALEKSRNLVSADIISRIGVEAAIQYARRLGITSRLGRNLSLSLGSSEVTMLEIARSYGVFANQGVLFPSIFIDKVENRKGELLYNYEDEKFEKAEQVVSPESAFLMANMMKGVVQRGTGWRVREIQRPVAGKTGTSNDLMDAWFVGYTPEWVCAVWAGFDVKRTIGDKETGGRVASPIWLSFMKRFLDHIDEEKYAKLVEEAKEEADMLGIEYIAPEKLEPLDFTPPEGVDPMWIDKETGRPSTADAPGAIYEYFLKGTEPAAVSSKKQAVDYLNMPDL